MRRYQGRESFLVKVEWVDDWPVFNDGRNITLTTTGRSPVNQAIAQLNPGDTKWQADLSQKTLELGWYQKSEFLPKPCITLYAGILKRKHRHTTQELLYSNRAAGVPTSVRQLLRPSQPRSAGHASQEAIILYRKLRCEDAI